MSATPVAFATKDNANAQLSAGISAADVSIPLQSGQGARFPQPYNGAATSGGTSATLNSTGISAAIGGSAAIGKWIWNKTDGSVAEITAVATDSITTTRLLGGTDNTWQNSDVWVIDPFLVTFEKVETNTYGVQSTVRREESLVIGRSTDTLSIATGGRGYNGSVANTFDTDDSVYLHATSPLIERLKDILSVLAQKIDDHTTSLADLASTADSKGASMVGVEDDGAYYSGSQVEAALQEIGAALALTVTKSQIGFFGDGNDGVPTWTSGASLNPSAAKRYTTATLPISQTLTVSSVNTPLVLLNTGSVTINGTVDLNAKGGAGGAGATSDSTNGSDGTAGASLISGWTNGFGNKGVAGGGAGGGGGGAGFTASGSNGASSGGAGGTLMSASQLAFLASIMRGVVCGAGGGGGYRSSSNNAGNGGAGGGALVWLIGGSLTLGSGSIIRANGANGTAAGGATAGGGGGGGGGAIIILVAGSITDSGVTVSATGGAGGAAGGAGGAGGNGGAGKVTIYSLSTGTLITA